MAYELQKEFTCNVEDICDLFVCMALIWAYSFLRGAAHMVFKGPGLSGCQDWGAFPWSWDPSELGLLKTMCCVHAFQMFQCIGIFQSSMCSPMCIQLLDDLLHWDPLSRVSWLAPCNWHLQTCAPGSRYWYIIWIKGDRGLPIDFTSPLVLVPLGPLYIFLHPHWNSGHCSTVSSWGKRTRTVRNVGLIFYKIQAGQFPDKGD